LKVAQPASGEDVGIEVLAIAFGLTEPTNTAPFC